MTLILICLTPEYVVHVSDRRLTDANDASVALSETANKAIFVDGHLIFGFTGLARVAGKPSDEWFIDSLNDGNSLPLGSRLKSLARKLPGAIRYAPPKYRALAFLGAGFFKLSADSPLEPFSIQISNFLNKFGRPRHLAEDFEICLARIPAGKEFHIFNAGIQLTLAERSQLNRSVRHAVRRGAKIKAVAQLLIDMIWRVARRNTTVGTSLMVCTLPRASVEEGVSGGIVASTNFKTNLEDAAFLYVGPETRKGVFFGPGIVTPGMSMKGIRMSFGDTSRPADITKIHFQGPNGTPTPPDWPCPCGSGSPYKGCHDKT